MNLFCEVKQILIIVREKKSEENQPFLLISQFLKILLHSDPYLIFDEGFPKRMKTFKN